MPPFRPLPQGLGGMGGLSGLPFFLPGPPPPQFAQPSPEPSQVGPVPSPGYEPTVAGYVSDPSLTPLESIGAAPRSLDSPLESSVEFTTSGKVCDAAQGLEYWGYSVKETSGSSPATFVIRRGTGPNAPVIDYINLLSTESDRDTFPKGIRASEGIYLEILTGAITIVVRYKFAPPE